MPLRGFAESFLTAYPHLVGRRVLVALSGGADSVALLCLLKGESLALDLEAAHVHHGVRGDEADRDAEFCEALCAELRIPFHLLRIEPRAPLDSGREGTWRRLRYRVLLDHQKAHGFDAVATGHHRDDVAEGVLVQLLRGGGPRALSGIQSMTAEGIIRPLLPWSRTEIRQWLEDRTHPWCEDSSNRDLELLRNRVRLDLLPYLESVNPAVRDHLVHLSETLAADEAYFAGELTERARWIDPWDPDGGVPETAIQALPPPLRARWLHAQTARVGLHRVTRRQSALFDSLIEDGEPRALTLARRWRLRRARGRLWLEPPSTFEPFDHPLEVGGAVTLPIPGWQISVAETAVSQTGARWSWTAPRDAALRVRSPAADDTVPAGAGSRRAARLVARRVPRHLRPVWPVICEDDRIYWIPGVWQDPTVEGRGGHIVEVTRRE